MFLNDEGVATTYFLCNLKPEFRVYVQSWKYKIWFDYWYFSELKHLMSINWKVGAVQTDLSAVFSDRVRRFSDIDVSFNGRSVSKPNLGFKGESDIIVKRR